MSRRLAHDRATARRRPAGFRLEISALPPSAAPATEPAKELLHLIPHLLLPCYALALTIAFALLPALPQDPAYHQFADDRSWLGIPNSADVTSNVAILAAALWGLMHVYAADSSGRMFRTAGEHRMATIWFAALVLTAFGSAWYHLAPDNMRLFWDRLPLALAFTTLPALLIAERIPLTRSGHLMLVLWVLTGPASVLWWQFGEIAGQGDLRSYFLLHAFMFVLPPVLIALSTPYTHNRLYVVAYLLFVLAMAGDRLDRPIFDLTGGLVSGHTLKHLLTAIAVGSLARMFAIRCNRLDSEPLATRHSRVS